MRLGIFDLIAPEFLVGVNINNTFHQIVSFLRVNELHTAWDDSGVVYSGIASYEGTGNASPVPQHTTPSGSLIKWLTTDILFRLTVPRSGASAIKSKIDAAASAAGSGSALDKLRQVLDDLGSVPAPAGQNSDYPGFKFRLELLVDAAIHLPKSKLLPAMIGADGFLTRDLNYEDVQLHVPKLSVVFTKGDSLSDVDVNFDAFRNLDDPLDMNAGEALSMVPPLAMHSSGRWGFGIDRMVLDLNGDFTPPEILAQFGTGDDFRGIWCPDVRVFFGSTKARGLAFDVRAHDLLIDFNHGVSGEFAADIMRRGSELKVEPLFYSGAKQTKAARGRKEDPPSDKPNFTLIRGSKAKLETGSKLQLSISGGEPPYTITVTENSQQIPAQQFENKPNRLTWPLSSTEGESTLRIVVSDNSAGHFGWDEELKLQMTAAQEPSKPVEPKAETPRISPEDHSSPYRLEISGTQLDSSVVIVRAEPPNVQSVTANGQTITDISTAGEFRVPVTPGGPPVNVSASWQPNQDTVPPVEVHFDFDVPLRFSTPQQETDSIATKPERRQEIVEFVKRLGDGRIDIHGSASYNGDRTTQQEQWNLQLSEQRAIVTRDAVKRIAAAQNPPITLDNNRFNLSSNGFADATGQNNKTDQKAVITFIPPATLPPPVTFQATVSRPRATPPTADPPKVVTPTPSEPARAPFFRRIGFRMRLERNEPVLGEINGEIDIQTADEAAAGKVRSSTGITDATDSQVIVSPQASAQVPPPGDGIIDYRLTVSYDSATDRLTEEFVIGAGESDSNGLARVTSSGTNRIRNLEGALLIFGPLLASSIDSAVTADGKDAVVPMALGAAELLTASILGLSGVLKTKQLMLFGVEAKATERLSGQQDVELNLLVDYGVEFGLALNVGPLHINSDANKPFRVRYRGMGIKADFTGGDTLFRPVFDTSKGYELKLGDPGSLTINPPFDRLLTILGARVARTNPLTVEVDLGMKVNLGVITVDRVRITALFRDPDPPSITLLPTGVSINIPKTLSGQGYIDLNNGIKGSLDVTVIPAKLRMKAGLALQNIQAGGRSVTAALATLAVEFPNPIPLFGTGLGLYGMLGLFAMHYKRNENPSVPVPALEWLTRAHGDPTDITAWTPDIDRWAFGVGAVAGTMEGGTVFNMKGMLLLELPGPRILLFVKAQILEKRPGTKGATETAALLGVVDVNLALHKLTIGIALNYEAKDLVKVKVPVEVLFSFNDTSKWHLFAGSIDSPASAEILGAFKAKGYLMFAGDQIPNFPAPNGAITLPGLAVALGIRASLVLGDEDARLYLKVSAALDAALVFSPFHVYGSLKLEGELRLFIVSISAHASLEVDAPSPTFIRGEACGKVDFWFFSVEGCVRVEIGNQGDPLVAPPLLTGMVLQSRSPALVDGQGTDSPIDSSLGDAKEVQTVATTHDPDLLVVPIDSVPILKFHAAPVSAPGFTTFTLPIGTAPRSLPQGWIDQGGGRSIRYKLHSVEISPPLPPPPPQVGLPPATWQSFTSSAKGADTSVALALFSWEPDPTPRAVVRSTELTERVGDRWEGVCDSVAPPAPVLWTFNQQPLGPSDSGWLLNGAALPDPPDTQRSVPPDTKLVVHGPEAVPLGELFGQLSTLGGQPQLEPAKVIGDDPRLPIPGYLAGRVLQLPFQHPSPPGSLPWPEELDKLRDPEPERIIVESGAIVSAVLLLAVSKQNDVYSFVRLRALDEKNNLLKEETLASLSPKSIASMNDLPASYTDPARPWAGDVSKVMTFFNTRHNQLSKLLVTYKPPAGTVRFEINVHKRPVASMPPALLLGTVELLRQSETIRQQHDDAVRTTEISTVEGALDAGRPRPLLVPDTRYTISVSYSADSRQADENGNFDVTTGTPQTQRYTFVTANTAPKRLDPWVLATTPNNDQPSHFSGDPVQIVFNDASVVQLFNSYGKNLRAVVRKSNGKHPTTQPPLNPSALTAILGTVLTPYEDTLRQVIAGGDLPCIHVPPSESHQVFSVPVPLDRATAYTLEIQTQDPLPTGTEPRLPLFAMSFTTSRFSSSGELAGVMKSSLSSHRALKSTIEALPDTPTDRQIEDALLAAGLESLPPATDPGFTYLWQPSSGSYTLAAILIDAPEPLWRYRPEPALVTDNSDTGPVQHWALQRTAWLEIVETGTTAAARFVRSPGGTRTLMMVNPGAAAANLVLRQRQLGVMHSPVTDSLIYTGSLPVLPPWAEEV